MGAVIEFVSPVVAILGGFSLPLKVAWGMWLAWGIVQLAWHFWPERQDAHIYRTTQPNVRQPEVRPSSTVRPPSTVRTPSTPRPASTVRSPAASSVKKPTPAAVAPYGTSDFIAALDQEQPAATDSSASDATSTYR